MRKRILSLLLCLVMVVGMLPTTAFAIWGVDGYYECIFCGAVYYGDDVDDSIYEESDYCCGIDGNQDCWLENHCYECGEYVDRSVKNDCCNWCEDCIKDQGTHCSECDECYLSEEDQLCGECHRCDTCAGGICEDCGLCDDCAESGDNTHCIFCGACASSADWHDDTHHCLDCCVFCEQCEGVDTCLAENEEKEFCDECGLCMDCCMENREAYGCEAYCVESDEFEYHFCEECGECFCTKEPCEYCGLCEDCCEANSDCENGMCVEDGDYEDHICPSCDECFCKADQCNECGLCETCCENALNEAKVEGCTFCDNFTGCVESEEFISHYEDAHEEKPTHKHFFLSAWCMDETHHWHECASKSCEEKGNYFTHNYISTGGDICSTCGYKSGAKVYFIMAPKDAHVQVSDTDDYWHTSGGTVYGPASDWNNRTTFRVKAFGKNLSYQWYKVTTVSGYTRKLTDQTKEGNYYVSGATTPTLTVSVDVDACTMDYSYYCVVTDGEGNTAESNHAKLIASHRYSIAKADTNDVGGKSIYIKDSSTDDGYRRVFIPVSTGHRWYCCGDEDRDNTRDKMAQSHDFEYTTDTFAAYTPKAAAAGNYIIFKKFECKDCGYVKYVENHECFMLPEQLPASDKNAATKHKMVCTVAGCENTGSALHKWEYGIVSWPSGSKNGSVYRECTECDYTDTTFTSWTAVDASGNKKDLYWNTDNILVDVLYGTADRTLIEPGETVVLTPELDGEHKFTGWDVRYFYGDTEYTEKVSLTVEKGTDGKWRCTIPADFFNKVPGGGNLYFTGEYDKSACTHGNVTADVGAKAAVCVYDGYTGDTVCIDCGAVVTSGTVIPGGEEHTGTLTLVPGTAVAASCSKRGYEGDFECSDCGHTVSGERTGYAHNNQTIVNAKAATCYEKGYTGDTVCADCGKSLANGKETPKLDHIWDEGEPGVANRGPFTFPAMIYHCTRPGCTGTKTGLLRDAPETDKDGKITKLDFTMTGYELGNTVGDVDVTMPAVVSDSTYRMYRTIPLKKTDDGMVFVPPTISSSGHIRNDGKAPLDDSYAFLAEKNYYLVVTVKSDEEISIHSKAIATLNETQSALYFGEVTIPPTKVGETTIPASTAIMAVFKLDPLPASSHNVTVKYSEAADSGAGEHEIGSTVTINAGTKEGYTFSGWTSADGVTFGDATSTSTSFTMPANDVTVVANWDKIGSTSVIESVAVTVKAPVLGEIATKATNTADTYTIANTAWVDSDGYDLAIGGTFAGGKVYTVKVELEAVGDNVFTADTTYTINGDTATVVSWYEDHAILTYEFLATEKPREDTPIVPAPVEPVKPVEPAEPTKPKFPDVLTGSWYEDAVTWAVGEGVTTGTTDGLFDPDGLCTRAQAVTFLWRTAGCPTPKSTKMPFTDVVSGSYYDNAVLWAVENGITKGTSDTTFSPDLKCSRAQIVTFLWRSQKSPVISAANPFTDVKADTYYTNAVLWAAANDITSGTSATTFSPDLNCTRAQIVTFLYRCMK